ncbi:glyoxalase [Bacillus tianshenii]|uniref:VOC family protein n=1 Tax=Sutcliffiella tianshenii TaxID=1463404 RepID=UPI001CD7552C|nr:glyoxalase [Bacillus tianshenii]
MTNLLILSHCIFPTPDIIRTAEYYEQKMRFRAIPYLNASEPHVCLYRDSTEIILTKTIGKRVFPNRKLYGYGYDAYFITKNQEELQQEFIEAGVNVVRPLGSTDYENKEFVIEDIDGRWLAFGIKTLP